jgi:transposase InsO family protein
MRCPGNWGLPDVSGRTSHETGYRPRHCHPCPAVLRKHRRSGPVVDVRSEHEMAPGSEAPTAFGTGADQLAIASPVGAAEPSIAIAASAGTICTCASTTRRGSPTRRSCPTIARKAPLPSLDVRSLGSADVSVQRMMTDNGNCYRSHLYREAGAAAGLRHLRTKPYTPRTNGKAERFIQTVMRECAYAKPFQSSAERTAALPLWLHDYTGGIPLSTADRRSPAWPSTTCLAMTARTDQPGRHSRCWRDTLGFLAPMFGPELRRARP